MKRVITLLIGGLCATGLAAAPYIFRAPTPRDTELAQLAGDWMFHDDWHAPTPPGAYATRWKQRIPESRPSLREKFPTIPIDVKSETNTFALFTYSVADRSLTRRAEEPDPWPSPRMIVREQTAKEGRRQLVVRWSSGVEYQLGCEDRTNGIVIVSIDNMMHFD